MHKLLIAVDGSELALDAVHHALGLIAQGLRADLVLANVQEPATLYEMVVVHDPKALREVSASAGAHLLAPAEALVTQAGVTFESVVETGDPVNTLLDIAQRYDCDGVVVGARGVGNLRGTLMGSVSQKMVQTSTLPVTVVKHID